MNQSNLNTILYVEDEEDIREELEEFLEFRVNKLFVATNGLEGLELFKENENELNFIITDVKMPIMDGIEMIKEIRKINLNIPIIVLTAFNESDTSLKLIENIGINGYLAKPINPFELEEMINTLSKKKDL